VVAEARKLASCGPRRVNMCNQSKESEILKTSRTDGVSSHSEVKGLETPKQLMFQSESEI
jgi:hypothetical protein